MKKILLFFMFINILPSGYSCPGGDPSQFGLYSGDYSFCKQEAEATGNLQTPSRMFEYCGGSKGAAYTSAQLLNKTDCGALCTANLNCFSEYWTNMITSTTNIFLQFYNAVNNAEKTIQQKIANEVKSNKEGLVEDIKNHIIYQIITAALTANPKCMGGTCDKAAEYVERRFQETFVHYSNIHKPYKETIEKVLDSIANADTSKLTKNEKKLKQQIDMYLINSLFSKKSTINSNDTCPAPPNNLYDSNSEKLSSTLGSALINFNYLLSNATSLKLGNTIPTICGKESKNIVDLVNNIIQAFVNPNFAEGNCPVKPNRTMLQNSVNHYMKPLLESLSLPQNTNFSDILIPKPKFNTTPMNIFGKNFDEGTYVTNHVDISSKIIALLAPGSPFMNIVGDYITSYLYKCRACSPSTSDLEALPIAESLGSLFINIAGFHKLSKIMKELRIKQLKSKAQIEKEKNKAKDDDSGKSKGDGDASSEADSGATGADSGASTAADGMSQAGVETGAATDAASDAAAEVAGAQFASRADLAVMIVYIIGSELCEHSGISKKDQQYCDPIGLGIDKWVNYCGKLKHKMYSPNSESGIKEFGQGFEYGFVCSPLVVLGKIWKYVIAPLPKYIGDTVMGLCDIFGGGHNQCSAIGKDVTKGIDVALKDTIKYTGIGFTDIDNFFKGKYDSQIDHGFEEFWDMEKKGWETVGRAIENIGIKAGNWFKGAGEKIAHGVVSAVHKAGNWLKGAGEKIAHGAVTAVHAVGHWASGAVHKVGSWFKHAFSWL